MKIARSFKSPFLRKGATLFAALLAVLITGSAFAEGNVVVTSTVYTKNPNRPSNDEIKQQQGRRAVDACKRQNGTAATLNRVTDSRPLTKTSANYPFYITSIWDCNDEL